MHLIGPNLSLELFLVYVVAGGVIVFSALMLCQAVRAMLGNRSPKTHPAAEQAEAKHATPLEAVVDDQFTSASHEAPSLPSGTVGPFEIPVSPVSLPQPAAPERGAIEFHVTPLAELSPHDEGTDLGWSLATPEARVLAPLPYVSIPAPRTAAAATPRSRPIIFKPEHYQRHAGVAGYLYMARNPFYFDGLYKLGYTTLTPQERLNWLNAEHRKVPDVGEFHLVHAVPVAAAYDAERALFDLLGADRPVQKREFFLHSEALLKRALDATQAFTNGNAGALDDFVLSRAEDKSFENPPVVTYALIQPLSSLHGGWIYVTHCQWHRSDIYRISYTRKDPRLAVSTLNARQKRLTCRIGFHTLVHCVCVDYLKESWDKVAASLERWRVVSSKVFYEGPIEDMSRAISLAVAVSQAPAAPLSQSQDFGDVTVELVPGQAASSWAAWARPCPCCDAVLRFTGTVGAKGVVECPACGCQLDCTVGASKAMVSAYV